MKKNSVIRVSRNSPMTFLELKLEYTVNHTLELESLVNRNNVWNSYKKSKLIESILLSLPIPLIYLSEDKFGNLKILDGIQRLKTVFDFIDNKFELVSCPILRDLIGKKFVNLDPSDKTRLEDYYVSIAIVKPPTPDYIRVELFNRLNLENSYKFRNKENMVF